MNSKSPVHNLESLEKEISRLRLEVADSEKQLVENFNWLKQHAGKLAAEEIFCKGSRQHSKKEGDNNSFTSERWKNVLDHLADRFADRAADGVERLFDKLFHKKKKHNW